MPCVASELESLFGGREDPRTFRFPQRGRRKGEGKGLEGGEGNGHEREGKRTVGRLSRSLPQTKIYDYIVDAYVVVVVVVGGSTQLVDELYDAVQQNVDDGRL